MNASPAGKAPAHLWIVGVLSLLWNCMGAAVYTLTMMRSQLVMEGADPEMVAALDAAPAWSMAGYAFGVWAALAGSILLLMRSRYAAWAFVVSFIGLVVVGSYEFASGMPMNVPQTAAIWIIAIFLLWYSWSMTKKGVLG